MEYKIPIMILAVLLIGSVSASFELGNQSYSIEDQYSPSDVLKGWINLSFSGEEINSSFSTNLGQEVDLIELIDLNNYNSDADYFCSPSDCDINYASIDGTGKTSKTRNLEDGEEVIYGLRISGGQVSEISDFEMNIGSNAGEWYSPQLAVDIFADGEIEWKAHEFSGSYGEKNYGCFNEPASNEVYIGAFNYCEKVTLEETPSVEIGADIIEGEGGTAGFTLTASEVGGSNYGQCSISVSSGGVASCIPEYFVVEESADYMICIRMSNSGDSRKYKIKTEQTGEICGRTEYQDSYSRDFKIYAKRGTFAPMGSFVLNNQEMNSAGLYDYIIEEDMWDYLGERYSRDCTDECIIPIKIISHYGISVTDDKNKQIAPKVIQEGPHDVSISDVSLSYITDVLDVTNKFYSVSETPARITSGFLKLNLEPAEFNVYSEYGNHSFRLKLKNFEVFSQDISIQHFPEVEFVSPLSTAASVETIFTANVNASEDANISSYYWDFGDEEQINTANNSAKHTYASVGKYVLSLTVTDTNGLSSTKKFNISVGSPRSFVKETIQKKQQNLDNLKQDIQQLTGFQRTSVENLFNLTSAENSLNNIQAQYDSSNESDGDIYIQLMQSLLEINLPEEIKAGVEVGPILFYPLEENIDLDIVKNSIGGEYKNSEKNEYITSILLWNQYHVETEVSFSEITAVYSNHNETALRFFTLDISKQETSSPYLFIEKMENLRFNSGNFPQSFENYYALPVSSSSKTIEFSTSEEIDFVNIPAFISPSLTEINLISNSENSENLDLKWLLIAIGIIIAILSAFFIIKFKKKTKEKSARELFKNKKDFFNVMGYISRMKRNGLNSKEIEENLRGSKWNNSQIKYALKKHSRKNMLDAPVQKILQRFERKNK